MPPPYPATIPADVKHKFNDFDNLYDKLKSRVESLESEARRLTAREEELAKKDKELQAREEALTLRVKATDNNSYARLANSRLTSPHDTLSPLYDLDTNKPVKGFPKHEKDIRVMSPVEVVTALKALDMDATGAPAERKARLRMGLGMEREKMGEANGEGSAGTPAKKPVEGASRVKKPPPGASAPKKVANGASEEKKPVDGTHVVKKP